MKQDLVILVPDKNTQFALRGALARPAALGIRPIGFDFRLHPGRDGGVRSNGAAVLATEWRRFEHALMVLDLEGSGAADGMAAEGLESSLDAALSVLWGPQGKAIVVEPEVDAWIWGAENVLKQVLDWPAGEGMRDWLRRQRFEFSAQGKPERPKEAFEAVARRQRLARSSALYEAVTRKVSLVRCNDPAFQRLRGTLRQWFAAAASPPM